MRTNELLKLYGEGQRDFSDTDLNEITLDGEDLQYINLSGADLRKARLWENNFANSSFKNADLRGAQISAECRGHNIDFSGANFEGTGMYEGIIEHANFSRANFRNAKFSQYLMTECNFQDANFTNAWLSETDFSNGRFNGTTFYQAHLDVSFVGASIASADFSYAFFSCSPQHLVEARKLDISGANFQNSIFFAPYMSSQDESGTSCIPEAIYVKTQADMEKLDLSKYNSAAVENMLEHFAMA